MSVCSLAIIAYVLLYGAGITYTSGCALVFVPIFYILLTISARQETLIPNVEASPIAVCLASVTVPTIFVYRFSIHLPSLSGRQIP